MAQTMRNLDLRYASHRLWGPLLATATSLVLALACLMNWADVQIVFVSRSFAGTHLGEGQLTLGVAAAEAVMAVGSVLWLSRLAYLLPLTATAALAVTTRKYHEVGHAFSSFHGFRLAHASPGSGLWLAIVASAALLAASLLAAADRLRLEPWTSQTTPEVQ
jgi:hypothetical protein